MEDLLLEEVRRDVFERPKPSIDLDYLYSVKKQVQDFADETNSQLKKNVYQNYSLFIELLREISTLKDEMRQLNTLLEQQQTAMNKLLDQLTKKQIIQPNLERSKIDSFRLELNDDTSEVEAATLPSWFTESPDDLDNLIIEHKFKEAVDLALKVRNHFEQYPECCENNQADLKVKIDSRLQELVSAICSEVQPATDRWMQGGPRSSIASIKLLRELNLSSRAVKLYLDRRSSILRFVLNQQKIETTITLQFIKQICSIFFHNMKETCNEFKQAFELDKFVRQAVEESADKSDQQKMDQKLLFDLVRPIYNSSHPQIDNGSPDAANGNDISAHLLRHHADKLVENTLSQGQQSRNTFYNLSTYASLTYWALQELENFTMLFRKHLFNNTQLSISMIAESIYYLRNQCSEMALSCDLDMSQFVEQKLENDIQKIIGDSGKKLVDIIKELNKGEQWLPQQFATPAHKTRFLEEMNDVNLKTMRNYISEDLKLTFTACKTSFARCFLITVDDLAKVSLLNRERKSEKSTLLCD